jgi:Asp/Glu/hydantoin racemase
MRIRYLSLSTTKYAANYFPFLTSYIDRVKSPDTVVEIQGARVGRIDSFRFWELLDTVSILDSVLDAQNRGYDAVAIGNVLDPGLREARSMVDIPVLGLGETSMLTACMMGSRFGLIGANKFFGGRFEENVAKYGLTDRLAGISSMALTPHELDACFSDPDMRQKAIEAFQSAARRTMDLGAEVIVPAGGRVAAFLNAHDIRDVDGALILDGTTALITQTEAAVRLRAAQGSVVSRVRLYARASPDVMRSAAEEYAAGYNVPSLQAFVAPEPETGDER